MVFVSRWDAFRGAHWIVLCAKRKRRDDDPARIPVWTRVDVIIVDVRVAVHRYDGRSVELSTVFGAEHQVPIELGMFETTAVLESPILEPVDQTQARPKPKVWPR